LRDDVGKLEAVAERFRRLLLRKLKLGIAEAMDAIGMEAQGKYFIAGRKDDPVHPTKLTVRSTRLIRSLAPQGGAFSPNEREQIRQVRVQGDKIAGVFGTKVPYAAVHEFGGRIHQTPTPKQRRFFWAMFYATGEARWKAFALAKDLNITIPPRPFLRPAALSAKDRIIGRIRARILEAVRDVQA